MPAANLERRKCLLLSDAMIEEVVFQQKAAGRHLSFADHLCRGHFNSNRSAHILPILSHQIVCDHYPELPAAESRA